MENNELQELEQMREQYGELKERFDKQKIINDKLILRSMTSKVSEIRRIITFNVILAVSVIVAAPFVFHYGPIFHTSWAFVGGTVVLMLACLYFDYKCHRELNNPALSGYDLLSYSKSASCIKQRYKKWLKYAFYMVALWAVWLSAELLSHSADKQEAIYLIISVLIGGVVGGLLGYNLDKKVIRLCDDIVSQIEQ